MSDAQKARAKVLEKFPGAKVERQGTSYAVIHRTTSFETGPGGFSQATTTDYLGWGGTAELAWQNAAEILFRTD